MSNKKICFITTISGTIKSFIVPTAIKLHDELGAEITFICDTDEDFSKSLPDYINYIPVAMKRGIHASGFKSLLSLIKIFKEQQFDIVQYSTPNAALYASIAARISNVPIRIYGQWGIRYVGFDGVKRAIFKAIEKITCQNSTHIRSVSPLNMQFGISEKLYDKTKVKVNGNGGTIGVDLDNYQITNKSRWCKEIRQLCNISESDFVFCFCGRVSKEKGSEELFSAFEAISQKYPNVHLLIIGRVDDNHGLNMNLLKRAETNPRIHFCGSIAPKLITHYYSAADILVHPTYREGFGMVIQEAGAMGLATLTTRIPGAGEVMVDGESCILIKPRDTKGLEEAMELLISQPELVTRLGDKALERTRELYSREKMLGYQLNDYTHLFQSADDIRHIVLSEMDLYNTDLPAEVEIIKVNSRTITSFNSNSKVSAIVGSRELSRIAQKLDFPSLRLFQLTSAGFDNVPKDEYAKQGVMVANAGSVYSTPIAETVVFGILQFAKRLRKNPNKRGFKIFRHYNLITELQDKRVLILGAGNIGTAIADRLRPFGMKIDGYDPYCHAKPQYGRILRSREELLREIHRYDYVVSTLPDTPATQKFIDAELLKEFNSTAVFVNVGRKAVYNEDDLYNALKCRKIKGAVLDIFQKLPNPFTNKFRRLNNVIVWPGLSAISKEVKLRLEKHISDNLSALFNNSEVSNVINRANHVN